MTDNLSDLQEQLAKHSHSAEGIEHVERFSENLKKTKRRSEVFSSALIRAPILPTQTAELGFNKPEEQFSLLQGDIVSTEAAFFMGERISSAPMYVVLNSSCDLIPNRRKFAELLRVRSVIESEPDAQKKLNLLLRFTRRDSMYLPVIETDAPDVLCNLIEFDGICQIRSEDLLLSNRIASLTLVGWRIFACFARIVLARTGEEESAMRRAVERQIGSDQTPSISL